jgi:tetratricopeptide (TPR) repeat protein
MTETAECAIALDEFKRGVQFLRDRHPDDALEHFRRAAELEQQNPYYLSFFGLAMGLSERKWAKAVELCEEALCLKRGEVQLYLNLVEVYTASGQLDRAIRTLDGARIHFGADPRIERALNKLGKRRRPVLQFVSRGHFLNRKLGRLRHRLWKTFGRS